MLDLVMTTQFRKDLKRINKRGKDLSLLKDVLQTLREEQALEEKCRKDAKADSQHKTAFTKFWKRWITFGYSVLYF